MKTFLLNAVLVFSLSCTLLGVAQKAEASIVASSRVVASPTAVQYCRQWYCSCSRLGCPNPGNCNYNNCLCWCP